MCVEALGFIVLMVEWTPLCLKVVNEKLEIGLTRRLVTMFNFGRLDQVEQTNFDVLDRVSKATVVAVFTRCHVVRVGVAELSFVFFRVIKAFNSIV